MDEYESAIRRSLGRYKRRQGLHYIGLILYGGVVLGRPLWALGRNFRRFGDRAVPLLLLTLLSLGPPLVFYCWYIRKYRQAIARLAAGNLLEVTGEIVARRGNRYTLRENAPQGMPARGFSFGLAGKDRRRELLPGETVTVAYPASRLLWVGEPEAVLVRKKELPAAKRRAP